MEAAEVLTIVLSIHAIAIPIAITGARYYGDRSEWLQKSLSGVDALLKRLRQSLSESLRVQLASVPLPPASALLVNALGEPHPVPAELAAQGEAFRNAVHDFVRQNAATIVSYGTVVDARDRWARWARWVSWTAFLLVGWHLSAGSLVLCAKVFAWKWTAKVLFLTLAPTALLVLAMLIGLAGTLVQHDRIMDVRRTNDPL